MRKKYVPVVPANRLTAAAALFLRESQIHSALNNSCAQDTRPTWSRIRRTYLKPGILRPDPRPSVVSAIGAVCGSLRYKVVALQKMKGWLSFGQCIEKSMEKNIEKMNFRAVCTKRVVSSGRRAAGIILMVRSLHRGRLRRQRWEEMPPVPAAVAGNIKNAVLKKAGKIG